MVDDVDTRAFFVFRFNGVPRSVRGIGVDEHLVLCTGVVLPAGDGLQIHGRELPATQRIVAAGLKARDLLFVRDGEPVLQQNNAVFNEHVFELGRLVQEADVFLLGAKAHDSLDAGAVIPGAVKNDYFARGRKLFDVALEVPLAGLTVVGLRQSFDAAGAGVEVLGDALDSRALTCSVATFHDNDDAGTGFYNPLLHLDEFGLQALEFFLVSFLIELGRGGFGFLAHAFNFSPLAAKIGDKSRTIMHKHSN